MALLAAVGRDCVGAHQLLPEGSPPENVRVIEAEPLDEAAHRGAARRDVPTTVREIRAWCRVLEFAEEFGISVSFEPFMLWERRGG